MSEKKLKIIGPYTPDHPGPFCTRDGRAVRVLCTDRKGMAPIIVLVPEGRMELLVTAGLDGVSVTMSKNYDLMNAEEVPVAREFWVVGNLLFQDKEEAIRAHKVIGDKVGLIHVREVMPGDAE